MYNKSTGSFNNTFLIGKAIKTLRQQLNAVARKKNDNQENERPRGKRKWTQDIGMFWVTTVLMIGTLVVAWQAVSQSWEIKNEFKITNTPYLQIAHVADTLKTGKPFDFTFQIENLGKEPTKILKGTFEVGAPYIASHVYPPITPHSGPIDTIARMPPGSILDWLKETTEIKINSYSINGSPYFGECLFYTPLDSPLCNDILTKERTVIFSGTVEYVNLVTNEERVYIFSVQIEYPKNKVKMIKNDNYRIIN